MEASHISVRTTNLSVTSVFFFLWLPYPCGSSSNPPPDLKHRTIELWTKGMKTQKQPLGDRVMERSSSGITQKAATGKSEGDHRAPSVPCRRHELLLCQARFKTVACRNGKQTSRSRPRGESHPLYREEAAGRREARLNVRRRAGFQDRFRSRRRARALARRVAGPGSEIFKTGAPEAVW